MKKLFVTLTAIAALSAVQPALAEAPKQVHEPIAKHVIFIGLDGMAGNTLDSADMPYTKRLLAQGCFTPQKRCIIPSVSAPNWASIFMGSGPELHGYTQWGSKTPEIPSRVIVKHNIYPTIFQILRDAKSDTEIGALYEWSGIKFLADSLSLSHFAKATEYKTNPAHLAELAEAYIIDKKPELLAIIFDVPDGVGHAIGWRTPEYYDALNRADGYVERIVESARKAGIYDDTVFIITSDHGGIDKGHGGITLSEMDTPIIIVGKGIRNDGAELTTSFTNMDVAPTIARLLGIEAYIPQCWTGKVIEEALLEKR